MQVEAVTTPEAWHAQEPEWNTVVERSASASVFLTMEWLLPWWRHFRRIGDELHILVAHEGNNVIGLAPLYRRCIGSHGLGSLNRIGFIGDYSGDSEYLDFIIEAGREPEVLRAFIQHIEADPVGFDLAELQLLPRVSPNVGILRALALERGYIVRTRDFPCLSVDLPGDWEAYLSKLKPRFRTKVRSLLRRLPAENGAVFDQCTVPDELPARLESLFELHQRRWEAAGEPGSFSWPARRRFYHEVSQSLLRRGWLRFHSLRLEGQFAAHEFTFEHMGHVYFLQQGYDVQRDGLSIGVALKAHVIRESICRGAREYDFLGDEGAYKHTWGARTKWCVNVTLAQPSIRVRWRLGLQAAVARASRWIGRITPERVRRLKRRLQKRALQRGAECRASGERGGKGQQENDT